MRVREIGKSAYNYMPKIWGIAGFSGIDMTDSSGYSPSSVNGDGMIGRTPYDPVLILPQVTLSFAIGSTE